MENETSVPERALFQLTTQQKVLEGARQKTSGTNLLLFRESSDFIQRVKVRMGYDQQKRLVLTCGGLGWNSLKGF